MVNETSIVVRYKYTDIRGSTRKVYEDLDFFSFEVLSTRDFLDFRIIYAYNATQYTILIIATYNNFDISICLFIINFFILDNNRFFEEGLLIYIKLSYDSNNVNVIYILRLY